MCLGLGNIINTRPSNIAECKFVVEWFHIQDSFDAESATLMFETMKSQDGDTSFATIVRAIQEASQEDDAGTVLESAVSDFSKLVSVLRQAKKQDLLTAFAQVKSGAGFKHKDRAL